MHTCVFPHLPLITFWLICDDSILHSHSIPMGFVIHILSYFQYNIYIYIKYILNIYKNVIYISNIYIYGFSKEV